MTLKLSVLSDIHFELHADKGKSFIKSLDPADVDVLILAGDIINAFHPEPLYRLCEYFKDSKVLLTAGNHEYYHRSVQDVLTQLNSLSAPNLTVLNKSIVEIAGHRFLGCTLWFCEKDVLRAGLSTSTFSDFMAINGFRNWVFGEHEESVQWLKNNIKIGDVVITHHLPSYKCVAPQFQTSSSNCFFASHQDEIIYTCEPKLWVFGHSHNSTNINLHRTRILSNPFGYPHQRNPDFIDKFIIEI